MVSDHELPTHPIGAELAPLDDKWVLTFQRVLLNPIDAVWAAITDAEQARRWAPFAPSRDLDAVGPLTLTMLDGAAETDSILDSRVTDCTAPHLLVLLWGEDELRFALEPDGPDTHLVFTHTFTARSEAPSYAAGWHLCLAALIGTVQGIELPPVVGRAALDHGWQELSDQYGLSFAPPAP
jgi:uncharacterized protein YndB with AHSA1/START domain